MTKMDAPVPVREAPSGRPGWAAVLFLVILLAALAAALYFVAPHLTRARVETWARAAGSWGPVVLLLVQAAQILAAPVPGVFVPFLAGLLYGPVLGPLVTAAGTLLGSTAAYWIGRKAGRAIVARWIGEDALARAHRLISGKRWLGLVPLFLLPFSPSDILCFVAGILGMGWGRFTAAVALGRLPKDVILALGWSLGWKALG